MSSESELEDQPPLPVNLHFRDERVLTIDFDAAVTGGRRIRRNRRALAGAVAAALVGVLGVSAAYLAPGTSSPAPVVGPAQTASPWKTLDLDQILAGGGHVTIIDSRPNPQAGFTLDAVAWRAGPGICYGTATVGGGKTGSVITCGARPPGLSATKPTALAPNLIKNTTTATGQQVAIGFVSGNVAKVSLKIRGHLFEATVVALPGSPSIGAYVVWIGGQASVTSARDFTQITGYDSRGNVVGGAGS